MRALGLLALGGVASFLLLFVAAARLYPGGTWCERGAEGHRFWENFLCDLLHAVALNGRPNPGAPLATLALFALIASLGALFAGLPSLWPERRWTRTLVRVFGAIAVLGMIAVPLVPSDRFGALHGVAVMAAGGPGFVTVALLLSAELRDPRSALAARLGALAFLASAANMGSYVHHWFARGDCSAALPIVQRFALGLTLAWMVASGLRLLRSPR